MTLSKNIRKFRKKNHLTQSDIAEVCSVERCTVSNWEHGRRIPEIDVIIVLAKLFEISVEELAGEEEKLVYLSEVKEEDVVESNVRFGKLEDLVIIIPGSTLFKKLKIFSVTIMAIFTIITIVAFPAIYFAGNQQEESSLVDINNIDYITLNIKGQHGEENQFLFNYETNEERKECRKEQEKRFILREINLNSQMFDRYQFEHKKAIILFIIIHYNNGEASQLKNMLKFETKNASNLIKFNFACNVAYLTKEGKYKIVLEFSGDSCYIGAFLI